MFVSLVVKNFWGEKCVFDSFFTFDWRNYEAIQRYAFSNSFRAQKTLLKLLERVESWDCIENWWFIGAIEQNISKRKHQ